MVSEFKKKKYVWVYEFFFDYNKKGAMTKQDIDTLIKIGAESRGWKPADKEYKQMEENWHKIWNGFLDHFDINNDGAVTVEEWVKSWDKYSKNPSEILEWQTHFKNTVFSFTDFTKDGYLDCEEYMNVYSPYGVDKDEISTAFKKASQGKAAISRAEFEKLWKEFFSSDDPDAPGNFIFAKVNFD